MKKNYVFILAIFGALFSANAQMIDEQFETYNLGDMSDQNPAVWSSSSGDPLTDNALQVVEGGNVGQAGYISPSTGQDALLVLGNHSTGVAILFFDVFIPAGSSGYFNIQGETETNGSTGYEGAGDGGNGIYNSGNLYFNQDGAAPGVFIDDTTGETGNYPEDEWFAMEIYFNLFSFKYEIVIDGDMVNLSPVPFQADNVLGGIHFFAADGNHNLYIDNVVFGFPIAANDDFSAANFSVYPNPVKDILKIKSTTSIDVIQVYDVLGKLILSSHPETITPAIDMSALNAGAYFVNVTIGNASKTVQIIK